MKQLFLKEDFALKDKLEPLVLSTYAALKLFVDNYFSHEREYVCFTTQDLCYVLFGKITSPMMKKIEVGIDKLMKEDEFYGKITKLMKNTYQINKHDIIFDCKDNYFVLTSDTEINKIFGIKNRTDKFKLFNFYIKYISTFNSCEPFCHRAGFVTLKYVGETLCNLPVSTYMSYRDLLEENEIMYFSDSKYDLRFDDYSKNKIYNVYSKYEDKDLCDAICIDLCSLSEDDIESRRLREEKANRDRKSAQIYINMAKGKTYPIDLVIEAYDYCIEYNKQVKKLYEEEKSKGYKPKVVNYKDLTIFYPYLKQLSGSDVN